jgi:pimeloyl-ACP methyl ester carboxylesterase|tara:strand:+ start:5089 stop:5838 length:750 start_codon:yes stop_codon:yes gene_type:complete
VFISTGGTEIDKNRPTILLMHGSGLSHIVWSLHEQFYVAQGFNVLSIDLPGHGNSDGPTLKSIEDISDWVKDLMKKLELDKLNFLGHSQGCLVGIDFASRYPDLINKLVLVGGSYKLPVNQNLLDLAEAGDEKALILMMKWGYEGSKAFIGGNPVKKIINSTREIREILYVDLNACNNYKTGKDSLEKITCSTLCIFGDLDKMVPLQVGNKMAEMIKNSEVKIINNCGHMIIFERAFEMRKYVIEFLVK